MTDYRDIYASKAERYDALVSREDAAGLLRARLLEVAHGDVVETGAGTGRLTRMVAKVARSVRAFDAAEAMIAVAAATSPQLAFGVATHDALPVPAACADLALEGWAFGHALSWNPARWRDDVERWVGELERVTRPGGRLVLIETQGTGVETPFEGGHSLEPFHEFVTRELGFAHECVRTDYAFESVEEAVALIGFFFGERLVTRVRERGSVIVPECTGVYSRRRE